MDMVGEIMRYAIIENDVVKNIVVSEPDFAESKGWVEATAGAVIGGTYIDGIFTKPPTTISQEGLNILSTDKWIIHADGIEYATVTFTSDEDLVYFVVEGTSVYEVEPIDYIATLEITADAPGPIRVDVKNKQLILTAIERE